MSAGCDACGHGGCAGDVRIVDLPARDVLRLLPMLDTALAVTGGPGAVVAQSGPYAEPSAQGTALAVDPYAVVLRVAPDRLSPYVFARPDGECVLQLRTRGGHVAHRVRGMSDADRLILAGLARTDGGDPVCMPDGAGDPFPDVPGLVDPAPAAWQEGDQLAQLDAILADGGVLRWNQIADCPEVAVRSADAGVLPALFEHLCATELPLGAAVFGEAAAQLASGRVHLVTSSGEGRLAVVLGQSTLDVDLHAVHECLLVRSHGPHGLTSALELYDPDGRAIVLLTQFGIVGEATHGAWEDLTASLPVASW
ncbi:hypothetical protein [Microbacterium indicum]|uniref:hypothetical protein n=1 Tax=Microbacterium indicum TaxID=358100 RepID=UPI000415C284|nr:hypothetical protein [Microbacterium indicum]